MAYQKNKTEIYALLSGINSKASPYVNGPMEFRDITNLNFSTMGALTKRPGSTLFIGATVQGQITGAYEFQRLSGASYIVATANTNAYTVDSGGFHPFNTGLLNNALFSFVTFVDRLFMANGNDFFKFDGSNTSFYSLPAGSSTWGVTSVVGGGLSGIYFTSYGYLNDRGYLGPAAAGITINLNGITFGSIKYYGLTTQSGFGITAIQLYRSNPDSLLLAGTTYAPAGTTTVTDTGFTLSTTIANDNLYFTLAPRYMEIYNNQLFLAGCSGFPSTVFWSNIGEPEGIDPDFNAEFRTNDGDRVTGMKTYNNSLVVTKELSFHRVVGEDPTSFIFQQISDQYGCLSSRAMVVFENMLWFLDSKGIVQYNGANIEIISTKVEPIFLRMNIPAARDNATAIHFRQFNEVWFAIPVDGSTVNNMIVVYDYVAQSWTKYQGVNPAVLFLAKSSFNVKTAMFGGYSGNIFNFGASLFGDNGQGITCSFDSYFLAQTGQTAETLFRRFYLNLTPVLGVTQPLTVNFRVNYGSSISLTQTIYQNPYQTRLDFGLSARSIQAEVFHVSASLPLQITGFSFEGRFQRGV